MMTPRAGPSGKAVPYVASAVTTMTRGRFRLNASKTRSAGLLGPWIGGPCIIEVEVRGRLHGLHPFAVFAVWLYDDATANELDIIETTRWGDGNSEFLYYFTEFEGGVVLKREKFVGRGFDRHKFVCKVTPTGYELIAYGWWTVEGRAEWKPVGYMRGKFRPGQLRIGLWTPQGMVTDALGTCSVVVDKVDVVPVAAQDT